MIYEYRVVGWDAPEDEAEREKCPDGTREVSEPLTSVKAAKERRAAMKREAAGWTPPMPYDDIWIERRLVPVWERLDV